MDYKQSVDYDRREPSARAAGSDASSHTRPNFPDRPWDPLSAWRLQALYGPICLALWSIAACELAEPRRAAGDTARMKILQIGGNADVLRTLLDADDHRRSEFKRTQWDITTAASFDGVADRSVDAVVAIDWLASVPPSRRERAVEESCRAARLGVVLVGTFDGPSILAEARAINDLHWATTGTDHPSLGRGLELGFPDEAMVRRWLERAFPVVDSRALETTGAWQLGEALTIVQRNGSRSSMSDISAAAAYPASLTSTDGEAAACRVMVYGARSVLQPARSHTAAPVAEMSALAIHHAVESAAHRRALADLTDAITVERQRERDEFRATIASLATELRDLDGRAEWLAGEVRQRDETIANLHLALTTEGERSAALTAALTECRQQLAVAGSGAADVRQRDETIGNLQRALTAEGERATALEAAVANAAPVADAHHRFLASRAGRMLRVYTRIKSVLLRRH